MKLLKPLWINHDGRPIFSVDIHPDGSRLATGGQGNDAGRVVIWNMAPVINEEDEQKENVPKMLCQMDNHLACVNCIRWSSNGKYLASGGDDKVIMIWTIVGRYAGTCTSTAFGGMTNIEQWRCVTTLRGHSGDILDISWSPADNWLASCSVDNTVVIWNTLKWPEMVTILKGHTGLVKGVSWDPIGKYIASQSDDKSLRIWRVNDWAEETVITEPFLECGGTTHVLRLHWSPDGQFLVSAHAMNNSGSVAQIIERQGWKTNRDFVGHRKAITSVRFNPNIFYYKSESSSKVQRLCCTAIGSRDRSLSVWLTSRRRPLVVIHDLFDNSVLDLSWAQNGYQLVACSWDGTVAFLEFEEKEMGTPLTNEEKCLFRQKLYGRTNPSVTNEALLIEDADMLRIRDQNQRQNQQNGTQSSSESSRVTGNDKINSPPIKKGPTDKQIEIRMADGRRRITPLYIPPIEGIPQTFNSQPTTFSSSSDTKTKITIEKRDESQNSTANSSPSQQQQMQQLNKALPNINTVPIKVSTPVSLSQKQIESTPLSDASTMNQKRKSISSDLSSKRKPGRPSVKESPKHSTPQQQQTPIVAMIPVIEKHSEKKSHSKAEPKSLSHINLPMLKMEKLSSVTILKTSTDMETERRVIVDVENNINSGVLCAIRLNENDERKWEVLMNTRICGIAGNEQLIAAACEDNSISVFTTSTGRRLLSPIVISVPISRIACFSYRVMIITTKASLWMWDFNKHRIIIKSESLMPLFSGAGNDVSILSTGITNNGAPLICVSTGKSFVFNEQFGCWTLISNANDFLNRCTDLKPHSFDPSSLPLTTIQSQHKIHKSVHNIFSSNSYLQQSGTLSYIDQQLAASFVIGSGNEYRFWLLTLAQHLSQENMELRLRELCQYLIGPLFHSSTSEWDPKILGNDKREILKDVLSILTKNLRLQRLYCEFKEQLEVIGSNNTSKN